METASILWQPAAAVLSFVPSRMAHHNLCHGQRQLHCIPSDEELTYLRIIDVPRRARTSPLCMALRVKGFNAAPYCLLRSSKKISTIIIIELCVFFVSSVPSLFAEQVVAAKSFPIDETLPFDTIGYDIPPPDSLFQNTPLASIMELQLSVDRSIPPLIGNQYNLSDYLIPNIGILQASSYPPPEYYGGGGTDPPERPSGSGQGKGKGRESSWQDDEREYREGSAGGSAGGNNEESGPSKRKSSRKTPMACHFCRKRKLKCDGVQPTCHTCAEKSLVCSYDEQIRRRGPGKKNRLSQQQSTSELPQQSETTAQPSSLPSSSSSTSRTARSFNTPIAPLPSPPMPQYPYQLGVPPSGLESRIISSRLASESRYSSEQTTERYAEEGYAENYPSRVYTQQPRPSGSSYYPHQPSPSSSSSSYPGYQQSSYRDQPPLPHTQQGYHPGSAQQYYRQDYPSTSSYTAEYSSRRHSYAEEEDEYASEDDNTTSSRREPSPGYEGDVRRRGPDTTRQR